jgi:hypothetical protein
MGWFDTVALYLYAVCGLVVMLVTWPTAKTGRHVLRRWGAIADPGDEQVAVVVRYLRERRLLILPLMVLAPLTSGVMSPLTGAPASDLGLYHLLGSLLVAWLLAEALAGLRPVRGSIRTATLTRRRWQDLLPHWALALYLGLTGLAIGLAIVGLAAQPWADGMLQRLPPQGALLPDGSTVTLHEVYRAAIAHPVGWHLIVAALVVSLLLLGVGWLAVARRADADERVDVALRARSVRVAAGLGILVTSFFVGAAESRLTFLVTISGAIEPAPTWLQIAASVALWLMRASAVLGLLGWSGVINAPRQRKARIPK